MMLIPRAFATFLSFISFTTAMAAIDSAPYRPAMPKHESARTCSTVDARMAAPTPIVARHLTVARHQSDSDWCYAFAASDLLSETSAEPVSAFAIAMEYNRRIGFFGGAWRSVERWLTSSQRVVPDGGWLDAALTQALAESELCLESQVPSGLFERTSFKGYLREMSRLYGRLPADAAARTRFLEMARVLFPLLPTESASRSLDQSVRQREDLVTMIARMRAAACAGPKRIVRRRVVSQHAVWGNPVGLIDAALSAPRPHSAAILFDSGFVYRGERVGPLASVIGDHYSVVVGRRWNPVTHRCEYRVRDSFGSDCRQYRSRAVQCACATPGNGEMCVGSGDYWIPETLLREMTVRATALF